MYILDSIFGRICHPFLKYEQNTYTYVQHGSLMKALATLGDGAGDAANPPDDAGSMQADSAASPGGASKAAAADPPPSRNDDPTAVRPPDAQVNQCA